MALLPYIYLFYMFVSVYFFFFYMIIYMRNRKELYTNPGITKEYELTVITPAWNEEETIRGTIESIENSDYPIKELIIVNDASTDNTLKIAQELARKYSNIRIINNEKNLGKAGSLNKAIRTIKTELMAVVDTQSFLEKDSIRKLIGYFDDPKVGVATAKILVKNKKKFIEKMQALEYTIIAFTRKLLGFIGCIYVSTGPLSVYRTEAVKKVGGFDRKNLTEDIEMTWKLVYHGYEVRMNLNSHVETVTPDKFKKWWRQRNRWNIGGLQCLLKYKHTLFRRGYNMLGWFIVPYFATTLFLGVLGLGIFGYLITRNFLSTLFFTKYTLVAGSSLVTLNEFYFTATVLNILGLGIFILGIVLTITGLRTIKIKGVRVYSPVLLTAYLLVYLSIYPIILINSIIRIIRKDYKWW